MHVLGGRTLAIMLTGGAPGRVLNELLDDAGVTHRIIPIAGRTRISLNVLDRSSGLEYRFVPEGPTVSEAEWQLVLAVVSDMDADWLIASGSLPNGLPVDAYAQIADIVARRGQRFVLDTHGKPLRAALHHGITLLKPSLGELEGLLGRKLPDPRMQEAEAMSLVRDGAAEMVAVSLGEDGALLATRDGVLRMASPPIRVQTAVGAGDSFLGAMVLAMAQKRSAEEALRWGMAAGAAAIVCGGTARLTRSEFEARYEFYNTKPPAAFAEIVKGGGWGPDGYGLFVEKIVLAEDGRSFASTMTYTMYDNSGKPTDGGGEATGTGMRIGF